MLKIGLTGGIGSGKSRVASLFEENGIPVFDCDSQARHLMLNDPSVKENLVEATGIDFYYNGSIDKERLAAFLFASQENAAIVNGVIHPKVLAVFDEWCDVQESNGVWACAVESAILFESGLKTHVGFVVVVDAPDKIRLRRAMLRDGTTRDRIVERMSAQMPRKTLLAQADAVIDNSGDERQLETETCKLLDKLRMLYYNRQTK